MKIVPYLQNQKPRVSHVTILSPEDGNFPAHAHDICELLLFKRGSASYLVEGRRYPLRRNALILTRPGCVHRICIEANEPYERYNVMYNTIKMLPELYERLPIDLDVLYLEEDHPITELFRKMNFYREHVEGAAYDRLVSGLIEEIFYHIAILAKEQSAAEYISANPLIRMAVAYIEENLSSLESIDQICRALYITKSHLHHLFVQHMQITPKKYILSKRLTLAQRAIRSGKKPTEICEQCGFQNYATFYRAYKQFFGHTPSEELAQKPIREFHS